MSALGRSVPFDSAYSHVRGTATFLDDTPPIAAELQLALVTSPLARGQILELDPAEALSLAGVVAVYSYRDIPGPNSLGPLLDDEPFLPEAEVSYHGQPLAVVAAESREAAQAGARRVQVSLEETTPILSAEQAVARNSYHGSVRQIRCGDFDAAWARSPNRLEGSFNSTGQDHFYLESQAALACPDEDGTLRLLASTQNPSAMQAIAARVLGLERHAVVCECRRIGGGFGGKETQSALPACLAALVAHKTGRPARIVYGKTDDMRLTGKRHPFRTEYRVGYNDAGRILALRVEFTATGGAFADLSGGVMERALLHAENAYFVRDIELSGRVCRTNLPPNTAVRGFGAPQALAAIENVIQEIAQRLRMDALDVRRLNLYGREERGKEGTTTPYGQALRNIDLPGMLKDLEESSDYRSRCREIKEFNASSTTQLRGIALIPVKFGISFLARHLNQANALVNVYADGSVQVSTGATEMGQGVNTKIRQLVADALGIGLERVRVMPTSTEKNNNTAPTAASVSTDLNGAAALDACAQIQRRLAEIVVRLHEARGARPSFEEICELAWQERIDLGARGFYATPSLHFDWERGRGEPFFYFTSGAAVSEVVIDRFTGDLRVRRVDVLIDTGRMINPGIDRGQIIGGFVQGMGWCTSEELVYDVDGTLLSDNASTYKIPGVADVPEQFHVASIERENPLNIAGSRALGEPPLLLGISVWAAVKHALSFIRPDSLPKLQLPATGEAILATLTELEGQGSRQEPPEVGSRAPRHIG